MKKILVLPAVFIVIISAIYLSGCSKKHSPVSPDALETPVPLMMTATFQAQQTAQVAATQTYVATAGLTAQAIATQTAAVQRTATIIAATQTAVIQQAATSIAATQTAAVAAAQQTAQAAVTQTYVATAGQTAQAAATQTVAVGQTQTMVAGAQKTALAELTQTAVAASLIGTATPTLNMTATEIAASATAQQVFTLTYIATAGSTAQAAATATAVAQKTEKALQTIIVVTPSVTMTFSLTPTATIIPTNTPVGTLPPMPLTINADISVYDYDYTGGVQVSAQVQVYDAGYSGVPNAIVKFKNMTKGKNVTLPNNGGSGYYYLNYTDDSAQGNNFEVDVIFNGVTYTAQVVMPGNIQIDAMGNVISWQNSGSSSVNVYDPGSNEVLSQSVPGNSVNISSSYTISGTYQADLHLSNSAVFTGGALGSGQLYVTYDTGWSVDISSGSHNVLPTPTPYPTSTGISISAFLGESDLEGGLTQQANVAVADQNGYPISGAVVVLKNLSNSSQISAVFNVSDNEYEFASNIVYAPGNIYEVDVASGGAVYTAQAAAPTAANGVLSPDCNTVSWNSDGNFNMMMLTGPSQYFNQNLTGNSMDLSPYYTGDGDYSLALMFLNAYASGGNYIGLPIRPGIFAGASSGSYFAVGYEVAWDIEVSTP